MELILPAAGKGTRMAAVTHGGSKEMLTLRGRPVIERVILEAGRGVVTQVVVVSSRQKDDLNAWALETRRSLVFQPEASGLGPAVSIGLSGKRPGLVALPDVVFQGPSPLPQVIEGLQKGVDFVLACRRVIPAEASRYGIVDLGAGMTMKEIVEKPAPGSEPSLVAVAGRYGFSARAAEAIHDWFRRHPVEPGAEQSLTPAMNALIQQGLTTSIVFAAEGSIRHDCGSPDGYEAARAHFG
ncbi:MAG: NTP transferase domain-containing protein [Fimbriimonadaceae bacterium]|nr:NTP transferase domain-containing protein [Fimbriimonadaceae bacterium]